MESVGRVQIGSQLVVPLVVVPSVQGQQDWWTQKLSIEQLVMQPQSLEIL